MYTSRATPPSLPPLDDQYYYDSPPQLVAPAPQRFIPSMSSDIQDGIANMSINTSSPAEKKPSTLLPFPAIIDIPSNIPQSDEDSEKTLETAREAVLASSDPETQLVWAQDALQQVGINIDNRERLMRMNLPCPDPSPFEDQLRIDAINIVTFLSDQSHPKAQYIRGTWLEHGRYGYEQDKKEAFRCYSHAADKGFARSQYRLGLLFESSGDPAKALVHYHRGAVALDPACLYRVGMMTLRGQHGQPQDYALGLDMIRQSADLADENAPQGAYVWGMLLAGELHQIQLPKGFLEIDEAAARIEIEKAAFLKFSKAQYKMGYAYELGELGCEFLPQYSLHYYALAARQGESEAEMGISKWFLVGFEGLFSKNEEVAYQYAQRAAAAGLASAEFAMGYFSERGINTPVDTDLALQWYDKANKHGNADAQGRINAIGNKQILTGNDHEAALKRIKSTHGSKRGPRPARFSQATARLPSIGDGQVSQRRTNSIPNANMLPHRASTTPYPIEQRPPSVAPYPMDDRPPSVAPYPLDDRPPPIPAQFRHSSMDSYQMPPISPVRGGFAPPSGPRPTSAASSRRFPSGPPPSARPVTSDYGPPLNLRHVSTPVGSFNQPQPPPTMPPIRSFNSDERPLSERRSGSSQPSTPIARPFSNSPVNASSPKIRNSSVSGPPSVPSSSSSGQLPSYPKSSTPSSTVNGRPQAPMKKGPKTFEEMGVPASKQDTECVVM